MLTQSNRRLVGFGAALASVLLLGGMLVSQESQAATGVRSVRSVCAWDQLRWAEMTSSEQRLWARLGWSQLNWDSERYKPAATQSADWSDLTPQRAERRF